MGFPPSGQRLDSSLLLDLRVVCLWHWFSSRVIRPTRGPSAMSGDLLGCYTTCAGRGIPPGMQCVGARECC